MIPCLTFKRPLEEYGDSTCNLHWLRNGSHGGEVACLLWKIQPTQIWSECLTGTAYCHLWGAVTHPHSKGKTQDSHLAFPSTGGSCGGIKWPWGHQPQASLTRSYLALRPCLESHPETQSLKQPPGAVGLYIASPALTIPCLWL